MARERKASGRGFGLAPWMLLAVMLLVNGAWAAEGPDSLRKKALQLNRITGQDPMRGAIIEMLGDTSTSKKLLSEAAGMAKAKNQPFNINATYILARVAQELKEVQISQDFYKLNAAQALKVESGWRLSQAYSGLIKLLYDNKKYAESEKICREFLDIEADDSVERYKPMILRSMILSLAKQGKSDKATEILDRLIKAQPDNWLNVELRGDVYRENNQFDLAAKAYEEVIDKIKTDKRLSQEDRDDFLSSMRYRLSSVYVDLNRVDKAAENLKALLDKEPDNPTYNNDLGYIWADHDMNLAEAEKLIRKAIDEDRKQRHKDNANLKPDQDKDNAAYLDSLGWVLFKLKKYKDARGPLLEAVKDEDGQHIDIWDHLGDVHLALGEKAEAVAAWKKGIELAGSSKRDQERKVELQKKLKANEK